MFKPGDKVIIKNYYAPNVDAEGVVWKKPNNYNNPNYILVIIDDEKHLLNPEQLEVLK